MVATVLQILYIFNVFITFIFIVLIILSNKESDASIAWIMVILIFPLVGIGLYILIGLDWRKYKLVPRLPEDYFRDHYKSIIEYQKESLKTSGLSDDALNDIVKNMNLLLNSNKVPLTIDNSVKIYFTGAEHFKDLLQDIENAEESIHMEYFIWRSDALGEQIKNILVRKVKQGVMVRLIFDGLGSFGRISFKYRRELKEAGVKFSYFLDLNRFIARLKINYSNHKKIVVIDGKIAYTGGMNIGEEYINGGRKFNKWRDTHVKITGSSVGLLQETFMADWYNCQKESLSDIGVFKFQETRKMEIPVQIAVSGPDSKWDSLEMLYFNMINNANHDICIQSPYFIPDQAILKAMESAALSGVKVLLMMAGLPDKKIPWWSAFTYFKPLLEAGVRIFHYKEGFLHSKMVIMDDLVSTVGTCNMDVRSFRLNYEVNVVFYDEVITENLKKQFYLDLEGCREITVEELKTLSLPRQFRNSLCRIFSPLL